MPENIHAPSFRPALHGFGRFPLSQTALGSPVGPMPPAAAKSPQARGGGPQPLLLAANGVHAHVDSLTFLDCLGHVVAGRGLWLASVAHVARVLSTVPGWQASLVGTTREENRTLF